MKADKNQKRPSRAGQGKRTAKAIWRPRQPASVPPPKTAVKTTPKGRS